MAPFDRLLAPVSPAAALRRAQRLIEQGNVKSALLTAVGDTRTGFGFAVLWALGTWLLGVPLVLAFGAIGYGLTTLAVQSTVLLLFRRAHERAPFRLLPVIAPAWLSAGVVGVAIYAAARVRPCTNLVELAAYAGRHWRAAGPPPIESTRAPGHMPGPEEMVQ